MNMIHTPQGMRIAPVGPAAAYKTYALSSPLATHFREATCDEVNCQAQANGWRTTIDESTELGQRQAYYIRSQSGRSFREERLPDGLTAFTFEAGQTCFETHRTSLEREPLYLVRGGDWRGNPTGQLPLKHSGPESWVDDFGEHQENITEEIERG